MEQTTMAPWRAGPGAERRELRDEAPDAAVTDIGDYQQQLTPIADKYDGNTINTGINNYQYDVLGNLIRDEIEEIELIEWTVSGKVSAVHRPTSSGKQNLRFTYGADGQRIAKEVRDDADAFLYREHYIRDAQGNIMATYRTQEVEEELSLKLTGRPIYGSSRLGVDAHTLELGGIAPEDPNPYLLDNPAGYVHYELTDHLGNVTTVITDELVGVDSDTDLASDYFQPYILSAQGYDPGGSLLPGRNYSSSSYDYGFNGMRKDDEIHGATGTSYDFGARLYDPRVGRWLSLDPKAAKYPSLSPYNFVANSPIWAIDPNGEEIVIVGSDSYRRFVTQALIGLMTSKEGKRMVEAMSASNHKIVFADAGLTSNQLLGRFDNGDGTSTYEINLTTLNAFNEFERPEFSKEPLSKSPSTSAYHEMRHVEQIMVGAVAEIPVRALNDREVGMEEVDAVFGENMVRDQLGMPLRIYYGNSEVFPATWGDYEHTDQGLQMHLREGDWSTNWKTLPPVPEGAKFKTSTSDASSVRTQQIRPAPTDKATSIKLQ